MGLGVEWDVGLGVEWDVGLAVECEVGFGVELAPAVVGLGVVAFVGFEVDVGTVAFFPPNVTLPELFVPGHALKLQWLDSLMGPQGSPPCAGLVITFLERVCVPTPQLLEQGDHSVKLDITQSTGQGTLTLHFPLAVTTPLTRLTELSFPSRSLPSAKQLKPPFAAGRVVLKVLLRVPPPHDLLHACHAFHVPSQSTGQAAPAAQISDEKVGPHVLPPFWGGVVTTRVRVRHPWPHVAEHGVKGLQGPILQSTGQG